MPSVSVLVAVFVGGCAGGAARYAVTSETAAGQGFPWATLGVNLSGAFLLALLLVVALEVLPPSLSYARPLLGTGFCGAFTTFSAITVSTSELVRDGRPALGGSYLVASLLGGVAAGAVGLFVGRVAVRELFSHVAPERRPG